jgi:hypothetical protein
MTDLFQGQKVEPCMPENTVEAGAKSSGVNTTQIDKWNSISLLEWDNTIDTNRDV